MTGWMKKYKESLRDTPGPIQLEDIPKRNLDLRKLMNYCEEKGIKPIELKDKEKELFFLHDTDQ